MAEREAAQLALTSAQLAEGKAGFRCEREKTSDGDNALGPDGLPIPRPICDEGLCCGAA